MFPNRPNFFSCRKELIFSAMKSNLHAHVSIMHLIQLSRIYTSFFETFTQTIATQYQSLSTFVLKLQSLPSVFETINQRLYKTNHNREEKLNCLNLSLVSSEYSLGSLRREGKFVFFLNRPLKEGAKGKV